MALVFCFVAAMLSGTVIAGIWLLVSTAAPLPAPLMHPTDHRSRRKF